MPTVVIAGAPGVGKSALWLQVGLELSGRSLAVEEAGHLVRVSPYEAHRRWGNGTPEAGRAFHGLRRLRLIPHPRGAVHLPEDVVWLVDGPGIAAVPAPGGSGGHGAFAPAPAGAAPAAAEFLACLLEADGLIAVRRARPSPEERRLGELLTALGQRRNLPLLWVELPERPPNGRHAWPATRAAQVLHWRAVVHRVARALVTGYFRPHQARQPG